MSHKTLHLFGTPVVIDSCPSRDDVSALRETILQHRSIDKEGEQVSNVGGWHSNRDLVNWGGGAAHRLARKLGALANEWIVNLSNDKDRYYGWHFHMWANVSGKGDSNRDHTHPGSYWSAVAYVDDGYNGSTDPDLGGELQFSDPRVPMMIMAEPRFRFKDSNGEQQSIEPRVRPRTGMIVMFPSWLKHSVSPFEGPGTRISIATNVMPLERQA